MLCRTSRAGVTSRTGPDHPERMRFDMADDKMDRLRAVLNLPVGEIEAVFVDDLAVVIRGKLIGPMPEFGTGLRGGERPYLGKAQ